MRYSPAKKKKYFLGSLMPAISGILPKVTAGMTAGMAASNAAGNFTGALSGIGGMGAQLANSVSNNASGLPTQTPQTSQPNISTNPPTTPPITPNIETNIPKIDPTGIAGFATEALNAGTLKNVEDEDIRKSIGTAGLSKTIASSVLGAPAGAAFGLSNALLNKANTTWNPNFECITNPVTGKTECGGTKKGLNTFSDITNPVGAVGRFLKTGSFNNQGEKQYAEAVRMAKLKETNDARRLAQRRRMQAESAQQMLNQQTANFGPNVPNSGSFYGKQGGKVPKLAFFAYSHLADDKKLSNLLGTKVESQEHHLDGYKMKLDKKGETVITPDKTSTVKGRKFILNPKQVKKLSESIKGYKQRTVGGNNPSYDLMFTFYKKGGKLDKDSMPCNKPRTTPNHPTKSHVVKACENGKEKIIRFGQQGVKGSPEGTKRNKAFKARHARNIEKGKMSAAYWANVTKWEQGGMLSKPSNEIPSFKLGGIIAGGVAHAEKNKIGDRGIPVVPLYEFKKLGGKYNPQHKLAEIESKELILHSESAEQIQKKVEEYLATKDPSILEELGSLTYSTLQEVTDETCRTGCRFEPQMKRIKNGSAS